MRLSCRLSRFKVPLLCIAAFLALSAPPARAELLLGSSFGGVLYDVDPATGAATNPRPTGTLSLTGITFSPTGTLYGLTTTLGNPSAALLTIDPTTGGTALVGPTGLPVVEGDLAFDPTTAILYGIQTTGATRQLFTLSLATGAGTIVGTVSMSHDLSALTFDGSGNLYVLTSGDFTTGLGDALFRVDKGTGSVLSSTPLDTNLGAVAGMVYDAATGTFFVADGGAAGTDRLYALDPTTGALSLRGSTVGGGLAGLASNPIPEPASLTLVGVGALGLLGYGWRRRRVG